MRFKIGVFPSTRVLCANFNESLHGFRIWSVRIFLYTMLCVTCLKMAQSATWLIDRYMKRAGYTRKFFVFFLTGVTK